MTPRQYISNPMGKGSAIASQKVREELDKEFTTLHHEMKLNRYFIQGYRLIYHVMIPSRSVKTLMYDVVIEFNLEQDPMAVSIADLDFLVYSNCPSFVYTYAYTFYRQKMIPTWLQRKYPREILHRAPDMRNQYQVIFYERSLYHALRYITQKRIAGIEDSKSMSVLLESTQTVFPKIKFFDDVMDAHNRAKKIKKSKEDKKKDETPRKKSKPAVVSKSALSTTSKVKTTKVNKVKTASAKKVKKI